MTTRTILQSLLLLSCTALLLSGSADAKATEKKQPKRSVAVQPAGTAAATKAESGKPAEAATEITTTVVNEGITATPSAIPMAGEQIKWQVIAGGGTRGTSASYILNGTIGQTAAGLGTSPSYKLNSGFWQDFGSGSCCVGTTGNVDGVGNVDIADLTFLVDHLFITNPPVPCAAEANVDGIGNVDIADLTFLVDHLFITNPPLPLCP